MQAKVLNASSGAVSSREVDLALLGEKTRPRLLRAAVLRYQANLRQGTHSTRTRGEGTRTGRKPFRQKGTGNARAGDYNSPLWRGGATIFGPKPRSYRTEMPRRARSEALRSALLGKFRDEEVRFLSDVNWEKPSTRSALAALHELGVDDSALVVTHGSDSTIYRSFRNLPRVDVVPAIDVNAWHLLRRRYLVLVDDALDAIAGRFAGAETEAKQEEASDG